MYGDDVYTPGWIYEIAIARVAYEFLANDIPIFAAAGKYADGLAEKYAAMDKGEINDPAEELLHFLLKNLIKLEV